MTGKIVRAAVGILLFSAVFSGAGENLVKNPGFEEKIDPPQSKRCFRFITEGWTVSLNSGADRTDARLSEDSHSGSHSLELISRDKDAFVSAFQDIAVSPGQTIKASVWVKSSEGGHGYARFFFKGENDKPLGSGEMGIHSARDVWKQYSSVFKIPPGAVKMRVTVENLKPKRAGSVFFDDYTVETDSASLLENAFIRANVNPASGGSIDCFLIKPSMKELTMESSGSMRCGMAFDIAPAKSTGFFRNAFYSMKILEPGRRLLLSKAMESGDYQGVGIEKEFYLPENSAALEITVKIKNSGPAEKELTYRVQNILGSSSGVWTWPFADWLQVYKRNPEKDKISWDIGTEKLLQGWTAKRFDDGTGVLFQFDVKSVYRAYNWYDEKLETAEWYYSPFKLAPGETWTTKYSIAALAKTGAVFYAGGKTAFGINPVELPAEKPELTVFEINGESSGGLQINGKAEKPELRPGMTFAASLPGEVKSVTAQLDGVKAEIGGTRPVNFVKPVELPPPPVTPDLKGKMMTFFPYAVDGPPIPFPEAAGSGVPKSLSLYERLIGESARAYVNLFYWTRLHQDNYNDECSKDGKNLLFEMIRKYGCMVALDSLLIDKTDTDMEKARPAIEKKLGSYFSPKARKLIKDYSDIILCHFIADEIFPQNIPAMLFTQDKLREIDPERPAFPYLNHNRFEYIPYVPVFLGDTYPIKDKENSGRNPWQLLADTRAMAGKCGPGVPAWVMPQGFAYYKGQYKLPAPPEMRLMLYGSVANGAKGIVFHGWFGQLWPWRYKYGYHYNLYGFMPYKPLWDIVGECGREITAVGPCLLGAYPETEFKGASLDCNDYKSSNGLYKGKAAALTCLKQIKGEGRFLFVQNQNIEKPERGTLKISYSSGTLYNLTSMRKEERREIPFELIPGGMEVFFLGPANEAAKVSAAVFKNRYDNEARLLRLDSDFAAANGADISASLAAAGKAGASADAGDFENALALAVQARAEYERELSKNALGADLKEWREAGEELNNLQFLFMTHIDLVVPPDIRKATKNYEKFNNTADPAMQKHADTIAADCAEHARLDRELRHGAHARISQEMKTLAAKIRGDRKSAEEYIKSNESKIIPDTPFD